MCRRLNTTFLAAGLLAILATSVSPPKAQAGAGGFPAGGIPIYPPSAPSEGLCAKVGELPAGATPVRAGSGLAMGYIDTTGEWAIPPRFRRAEAFSRGIARVQDADDKPYYYIDPTGQRVSDELVKRTQAGLTRVRRGRDWGFTDPATGEMILAAKYNEAGDFSEGLAVAMVYSTRRSPAEPPVYRWTWIDYTGREVVALDAPYIGGTYWAGVGPFNEGLAAVAEAITGSGADGTVYKFGYIDRTGTFVIKPQFDRVGDFHGGRAEVCIDGKWGFIDRTGKVVIPLEYAALRPFSEGLAAVKFTPEQAQAAGLPPAPGGREDIPGWWGYVDRDGKMVISPEYRQADAFSDGVAYVENPDFRGYIDPTGKIAFDLTVVDWNLPEPPRVERGGESAPQPAPAQDAPPQVGPPRPVSHM